MIKSAAKAQKSAWFLKALRLMTTRPTCFKVKQYTGSKCCLKKHEVYLVNKYTIALNRDNDKRIVQVDGIATLARGHVALSA